MILVSSKFQYCAYDIQDMGGHALETSQLFDTFGFTAAEFARKRAVEEQQKRSFQHCHMVYLSEYNKF